MQDKNLLHKQTDQVGGVGAFSQFMISLLSQQTFDVRLTLKTRQILTLDLRCILVVFANCFDVRI